jgi:hypothetical protein
VALQKRSYIELDDQVVHYLVLFFSRFDAAEVLIQFVPRNRKMCSSRGRGQCHL